jgi:hypothetical protein
MAAFRTPIFGRAWYLSIFVVFAGGGVVLVAHELTTGGKDPPLSFALLWLAGVAWVAYWLLLRVAFAIELRDGQLRWETPLRRGSSPLSAVTRIRPMRWGSNVEVFELRDSRPVLVMVTKGFSRFLDDVAEQRPDLEVRLGLYSRVLQRLPGPSGWQD